MNWKTAIMYICLLAFIAAFFFTVDVNTTAVDVMEVLKEHNPLADNNTDGR